MIYYAFFHFIFFLYSRKEVRFFYFILQNALLLTEALKEREAQVKFQEKKRNLYKSKDEEIECERRKAILKEEEKAKECHMKRMQLCKDQLKQ